MNSQSSISSVCVYCGSRMGAHPSYEKAAIDLGEALAMAKLRLVYGAGDIGLMGTVARAAQDAGATTFGVIPEHLLKQEVGKSDLDTYIVTETMHERKKVMLYNADAIVLLPGGVGSLDEIFEAITWRQLGLHNKPLIIININGYWDPLRSLIDHVESEGFAGTDVASNLIWVDSVAAVMNIITA